MCEENFKKKEKRKSYQGNIHESRIFEMKKSSLQKECKMKLFTPQSHLMDPFFLRSKKEKKIHIGTPDNPILRTCCALCARKKIYRNTLYCVVVAYLVFFSSGAPIYFLF